LLSTAFNLTLLSQQLICKYKQCFNQIIISKGQRLNDQVIYIAKKNEKQKILPSQQLQNLGNKNKIHNPNTLIYTYTLYM